MGQLPSPSIAMFGIHAGPSATGIRIGDMASAGPSAAAIRIGELASSVVSVVLHSDSEPLEYLRSFAVPAHTMSVPSEALPNCSTKGEGSTALRASISPGQYGWNVP